MQRQCTSHVDSSSWTSHLKFLKKAVTCLIITDESLANSILDNLVMHPVGLNVISNIYTSLHSKGIWFSIIAHAVSALNRSTILLLCVTVQRMERLVLCGRRLVGRRQDTELSHYSGKSTRMFSNSFGKKGHFAAQVAYFRWNPGYFIAIKTLTSCVFQTKRS